MGLASNVLVLVCPTGNGPCCKRMCDWISPAHGQVAVYMSPACGARLLGRALLKQLHKEDHMQI